LQLIPLIALASALVLPVRAADPSRLQSYGLGMEDGLANNSVYCAIQDHAGLMWFGTFGGLSRYDGESFVTYRPRQGSEGAGSLPASVVFSLLEDSRGRLWVGTDGGGLAHYKPDTDSFEVFRALPGKEGGLPSDRVLTLAEDRRGSIWAGLGDGTLGIFDPSTQAFKVVKPASAESHPIRCLLVDRSGAVWAGTEGGGLLRLEDASGQAKIFLHDPRNGQSIASNVVRSLLEDSEGRIWAGLSDGGVDLFDGGRFLHAKAKEGAAPGEATPKEAVRALGQDAEGSIWVGYADSGLGYLVPSKLELHPPKPGSEAMVRSIYPDRRGLMWVGLKEGGLRTYNLGSALFDRYSTRSDGKPLRDLRGICELGAGRMLVGSDGGGIVVLDQAEGKARPFAGLPGDQASQKVYAILRGKDGNLWVGTDGGGLVAIDAAGRARVYRHDEGDPGSIASDVVWALYDDPSDGLWVGTEGGGLDRFDSGSGRFIHHRPDPSKPSMLGSSVRAIFRDSKGRLWVGTWDGGLSRMDPGAAEFKGYGRNSADQASLGDASVNCIFEDRKGCIWVGTGGSGLARLDPSTGAFRHFTERDGLMGATVYGVVEDKLGDLWISTSMGLSRLDGKKGGFFNFGTEDGLASKGLAQNSLLIAKDGGVWAGGADGLTHFYPDLLPRAVQEPPLAILGIETLGKTGRTPILASAALENGEIRLGYRNSGISFHIAVLDYGSTGRNRYAMRLEGRQEGWIDLGLHSDGTIAPLNPGRYTLRVKGSNGNGIWNEEGASLSILVASPFWQSWWFRLIFTVFCIALVAGAIAIRVRSLRRRNALLVNFSRHIEAAREEERIAAAREVHDEIGQHLAAINLQAYWLQGHPATEPEERQERIGEMLSSISDAMGSVKAVATALRPVALDALAFDEALRWYLRSFERRSGIKAAIELGKDVPQVEGPLATALFRILQEMLTNVLRHSGARNIVLKYGLSEGSLVLEIRDDGKGIDEERAKAEDSFGIIGMRERCAAFGGSLKVQGAVGAGTTISACIPFPLAAEKKDKETPPRRLSSWARTIFGRKRC
jgi:signal transduction histidine kinase/ligand-binding sensor domain-containing protein